MKQTKITKSARGKDCQVRVMGVCRGDTETTVFAHLNGGGMGRKHSDLHGAYACRDCHAWLDGEYVKDSTREQRDFEHMQGIIRTQAILLSEGLIKLA